MRRAAPRGPADTRVKMKTTDAQNKVRCSFCGKESRDVRKLIAGPKVHICDECVSLCREIIEEDRHREPGKEGKRQDGQPARIAAEIQRHRGHGDRTDDLLLAHHGHAQQAAPFFIMLFTLHGTQGKELRAQAGKTLLQAQGTDKQIIPQQLGNRLANQLQATPIACRYPDPFRLAIGIALDLWLDIFEQVEFVVHLQDRQPLGTNLAQHRQHLLDLLHALWLMGVDHMQQQVGVARLFERSPKCLDQLVRQMANEAHGIGQHDRPQVVELQAAQGRVEGGEQLVLRQDRLRRRGFGQGVEQGALASVRVAHEGYPGQAAAALAPGLDPSGMNWPRLR